MLQGYSRQKNNANSDEVEFVSVSLLFIFWIHLWLFISSRFRGRSPNIWQHCMYHLHLSPEGASVVIGRVELLGLPWEVLFSLLGKL